MEEIRTFGDILDEIVDLAKLDSTEATRTSLKRKVNTVYQELCFEEAYNWNGETRPLTLKSKYTTGTVSITQNSDTVTGVGTAWSENSHRFWKMRIGGGIVPLTVRRVASATSIVLDAPWTKATVSGGTYTLYKDEYGLFPDCQSVRSLTIPGYAPGRQPRPCGVLEMDDMRSRYPFRSGMPDRYTINGSAHYNSTTWATFKVNYDYWEDSLDSTPSQKNLIIWPAVLTEDQVAMLRFTKKVRLLGAETDEPIMPKENRGVLVYGTLMRNFLKNRDPQIASAWRTEYAVLKGKMASQIEITDDDLAIVLDKSGFRRETRFGYSDTIAPWER